MAKEEECLRSQEQSAGPEQRRGSSLEDDAFSLLCRLRILQNCGSAHRAEYLQVLWRLDRRLIEILDEVHGQIRLTEFKLRQ